MAAEASSSMPAVMIQSRTARLRLASPLRMPDIAMGTFANRSKRRYSQGKSRRRHYGSIGLYRHAFQSLRLIGRRYITVLSFNPGSLSGIHRHGSAGVHILAPFSAEHERGRANTHLFEKIENNQKVVKDGQVPERDSEQ